MRCTNGFEWFSDSETPTLRGARNAPDFVGRSVSAAASPQPSAASRHARRALPIHRLFTPSTPPVQPVMTAVRVLDSASVPLISPKISAPRRQRDSSMTAQRKPCLKPLCFFILPHTYPDSIQPVPNESRERKPEKYRGRLRIYITKAEISRIITAPHAPTADEKTYVPARFSRSFLKSDMVSPRLIL